MATALQREKFDLEVKWAGRIKAEPDFGRRQALYRAAYAEYFAIRKDTNPDKVEFGFKPGLLWGLTPFLEGRVVLDMGAGYGESSREIARHARRVIAIDAGPETMDAIRAKARAEPKIEPVEDDVRLGTLPSGSVDVVYSNDFFEHLTEADARCFLAGAFRVLRPGGHIVTFTPNRLGGPFDMSRHFVPVGTPSRGLHLREYTYAELAALLREAGFRRLRARLPWYALVRVRPLYGPVWLKLAAERLTTDWASGRIWDSDVGLVGIMARRP